MPEVALQDYLQEINGLVDDSHLEAAIRHCRHILKQFPRHVETYRLLGKALLEQDRLADAADVFHRVLSADPEDFIAHAGLAIVHRQQNLLREAAWHMERAFEVEPYNGAIRESLQDLIGRRDGLPPEQLTLTPGALARMHVQGELYAQAIAELRRLLAVEQNRIDLHVLLAEALWRDGQRIDAAEECNRILGQLPDCIKAHAILAEVYLVTDRVDEAQEHLRRVFELVLPTNSSLSYDSAVGAAFRTEYSPVLPNKIPIDRATDELTEDRSAETADWVQDLDLGEEFALEDAGPEWLGALEDEGGFEDEDFEILEIGRDADDQLDATGETTNLLRRASDQLPGIGEVREETDWDAWLDVDEEVEADFEHSSPGDRPSVEEVGMDNMDERGNGWEEFPEGDEPRDQRDAAASGGGDDDLEWLDELQQAGQPSEDAGEFETMDDSDLPDWLREGLDADDMEGSELEWLDESDEATEAGSDQPPEEQAEELPDWLSEDFGALEDEGDPEEGSDLSWLDQIAAGEGDPLEEPPTMSWPDEEGGEADDDLESAWDEPAEATDADVTDEPEYPEPDAEPVAAEGGPVDEETAPQYSDDDIPEDLDEAMAWLEQLAAQQGAPADELPSLSADVAGTEQPLVEEGTEDVAEAMDWLDELAQAEGEADFETEAVGDVEAQDETPDVTAPQPGPAEETEDVDEAMAWLEELASEAGAEEVTFEDLEDRADIDALADLDELPDDPEQALAWLEGLAEESDEGEQVVEDEGPVVEEETTPPVPLDVVAARAEAEAILLHDQLSDTDSSDEAEVVEDIPDDPDEAMAWLERLAARQGASIDELPSLADVDIDADEDVDAPDWLAEELAAAEEEGDAVEDDVVYSEAAGEIDDTLYEDIEIAVSGEREAEEVQDEAVPLDDADIAEPEAMEEIGAVETEGADTLEDLDLAAESFEDDLPDWLDLEDEGDLEAFDWEEPAFEGSDWLQEEEPVAEVETGADVTEPEEPLEAEAEMQADDIEAQDVEAGAIAEEPQPAVEMPEVDEEEPVPAYDEPAEEPVSEEVVEDVAAYEDAAYEEAPYEEASYEEASYEEVDVSEEIAAEAAEGAAPVVDEVAVDEAAVEEAVVAEEADVEPADAEPQMDAQSARQALEAGNVDEAIEAYEQLLETGSEDVSALINDLESASESHEDNPRLVQLLGDAYNQNGQLQKALDAYRQALEML